MIRGCPHFWRSSSPSARMKMSLRPPALVVVMALTGRVGQSCANAVCATAAPSAADSSKVTNFMVCLPRWILTRRGASLHVGIKTRGLDRFKSFVALLDKLLGEFRGRVEHSG